MATAGPLLVPGADAVGNVVYPQLGGLTDSQASVIVVIEHTVAADTEVTTTERVVDVRVDRQEAGEWTVVALASTGGVPPADVPPLSPAATAVLSNPRIDLPDSARWDVERGLVAEPVLSALNTIAETSSVRVTAFATGHPVEVFDTDRVSNHTEGRAVDVWAVDGATVFDQRSETSPLLGLVDALLATGVSELGSPWDVDGPGGASFTNAVHQDHLHVGFDAAEQGAG